MNYGDSALNLRSVIAIYRNCETRGLRWQLGGLHREIGSNWRRWPEWRPRPRGAGTVEPAGGLRAIAGALSDRRKAEHDSTE